LEHGRTREKEISKLIKLPNAALTWQNERKLLRAMVDQVPDYLFVKDLDCRFIIANEAIARIHGFDTTDEVIGMTDFDLHDAVTAKKILRDRTGCHPVSTFDHRHGGTRRRCRHRQGEMAAETA
jgi:PAS domain S-box-containing protein